MAVVGDGINDLLAFVKADVSISLQNGLDVAKETADVILLDGDLRALPRAIDLSRDVMTILRQNINIVVAPTAAGIVASAPWHRQSPCVDAYQQWYGGYRGPQRAATAHLGTRGHEAQKPNSGYVR